MATLAKLFPRPEATSTNLKSEVNDYLRRAANLERQQQSEEASVLYRRVISLIGAHEGTSAVDNELVALKREANQRLMRSSLNNTRTNESNSRYQTMVRQLSSRMSYVAHDDEAREMSDQVFQDPAAFQPVADSQSAQDGNSVVLFQLDSGAKLFYLAKDGSIKTTSETLPLTVYRVM